MTRILGHCVFRWSEEGGSPSMRAIEIEPDHCERCIRMLVASWPGARLVRVSEQLEESGGGDAP